MSKCVVCGREVIPIEISLTKKLINRDSNEYLCKECLAKKFSCTTKQLDDMAEKFRSQGCALFL